MGERMHRRESKERENRIEERGKMRGERKNIWFWQDRGIIVLIAQMKRRDWELWLSRDWLVLVSHLTISNCCNTFLRLHTLWWLGPSWFSRMNGPNSLVFGCILTFSTKEEDKKTPYAEKSKGDLTLETLVTDCTWLVSLLSQGLSNDALIISYQAPTVRRSTTLVSPQYGTGFQ